MQLFGFLEAQHYCSSFSPEIGEAERSLIEFKRIQLNAIHSIKEGTPLFQQYRACALRDTERSLFLSISHYRRCLDLLIPSSSPWAHVTMYYGCWFAAKALLGMFGATIFDKVVIDVEKSSPSTQELCIRKIGNRTGEERTTYTGSHRQFWDLFYRTVSPLRLLVSPTLSFALLPISSNPTWQIERRNQVNYDTFQAINDICVFKSHFSSGSFPSTLPGFLRTQYTILENLLEIAFYFAGQLPLKTDALSSLSIPGARCDVLKNLIYSPKTPRLVLKTKKTLLTKRIP